MLSPSPILRWCDHWLWPGVELPSASGLRISRSRKFNHFLSFISQFLNSALIRSTTHYIHRSNGPDLIGTSCFTTSCFMISVDCSTKFFRFTILQICLFVATCPSQHQWLGLPHDFGRHEFPLFLQIFRSLNPWTLIFASTCSPRWWMVQLTSGLRDFVSLFLLCT